MNRQRQEVQEKVYTEVIAGGGVIAPKRGRKGRKSVGVKGVANQEIVNTLRANDIFTDNITFTNANGTISINVGPLGTSNVNQGTYAIAIGSNAGLSNQGSYAVAIGTDTGKFSQGEKSFAIGTGAGESNQGIESIYIGYKAGACNTIVPIVQKSVAIGNLAGELNQDSLSIAIGERAGRFFQESQTVAIGELAGAINQNFQSIALGPACGFLYQSDKSIGVGNFAGYINQGSNCTAIGSSAGTNDQQSYHVAIGQSSASTYGGTGGVAIGNLAGYLSQGEYAISIGYDSALANQSSGSIAIGLGTGKTNQGEKCLKIGGAVADQYQTSNCVAIGINAGYGTQLQNTICIGGGQQTLTQNSCYINNIRQDFGPASPGILSYNTTTGEVFQDIGKTFVIDHPAKNDKYLVYACVESDECDVFYKGQCEISLNNFNEIFVPDYIKPIAKDFMIFVTPRQSNAKIIASACINNEKFKVIGHPCKFDYVIYGKRLSDFQSVLEKDSCKIMGGGPYTFYKN